MEKCMEHRLETESKSNGKLFVYELMFCLFSINVGSFRCFDTLLAVDRSPWQADD